MNFSTDNQKIKIALVAFLAGIIVAFIFYPKPESETVYKFESVTKTDTLIVEIKDTVYVPKTKIKTQVLRDTILIDFKPKISAFKASFPFEYGSTNVSGEVLGEVLKMTAINDFKLPVVTNTITETKTETIIKKPKGNQIYRLSSANARQYFSYRPFTVFSSPGEASTVISAISVPTDVAMASIGAYANSSA